MIEQAWIFSGLQIKRDGLNRLYANLEVKVTIWTSGTSIIVSIVVMMTMMTTLKLIHFQMYFLTWTGDDVSVNLSCNSVWQFDNSNCQTVLHPPTVTPWVWRAVACHFLKEKWPLLTLTFDEKLTRSMLFYFLLTENKLVQSWLQFGPATRTENGDC